MNSKKYSMELLVGVFVLIGLLCVGYLTIKLGKMELFSDSGYTLVARFASSTGLRAGANVEIAGVGVGKVAKIELDDEYYSNVYLRLREGVKIPEDTGAAIKTSGLIGDTYISLSPGGSENILKDGNRLDETQGSVNIVDLIQKYVFGSMK